VGCEDGKLMGSIKQLLEIIALFMATGVPLLVVCLCRMAKGAEDFHGWYQRRKAERP
jgi:hypothetical protein